jgi:hypothetical protein
MGYCFHADRLYLTGLEFRNSAFVSAVKGAEDAPMIALGLRRLGLSLPVTIVCIRSGSMSPRLFLPKPSWDCAGPWRSQ